MNADEVKFDRDLYLIEIHGKQEEEKEISVSVFGVPKELLAMTPEAFIPQPYHNSLRPDHCNSLFSEVVLRNLVAFEASAAPRDFMNAIVDKEEDVRLLRKSGIICNHLVDNGKVASLWNGLRRCVKLTKVKYLDQVITDVNKHYNKRWSIAVKEKISRYIFGS
ncbi:hypothetical protein SUGI_0719800 [Cryptomeria japonica]|nr:hypothetical protein SUGI_0719800 [Cryptomeria japonica]